jgi:hypothetical protein
MQLTKDLRGAAALLKALEDKVAALAAAAGQQGGGYTAPGAFLFDLLAAIGLQEGSCSVFCTLLERATSLLAEEAAQQGRRRALPWQPPAHAAFPVHFRDGSQTQMMAPRTAQHPGRGSLLSRAGDSVLPTVKEYSSFCAQPLYCLMRMRGGAR